MWVLSFPGLRSSWDGWNLPNISQNSGLGDIGLHNSGRGSGPPLHLQQGSWKEYGRLCGLGEGLQPFPSRIPVVFLGSVWLFKGSVLENWICFCRWCGPVGLSFQLSLERVRWLGSEITSNNPVSMKMVVLRSRTWGRISRVLVCHNVVSYCKLLQLVQDARGDSDTRGVTNDETFEINTLFQQSGGNEISINLWFIWSLCNKWKKAFLSFVWYNLEGDVKFISHHPPRRVWNFDWITW